MEWQPITEVELLELIQQDVDAMTVEQRRLWKVIKVEPKKWRLSPWGDLGGGFWVVAIIGRSVLWYNDIEDGFNLSRYSTVGVIDEYLCNQDKLGWTVQRVIDEIQTGEPSGYNAGPPEPLPE